MCHASDIPLLPFPSSHSTIPTLLWPCYTRVANSVGFLLRFLAKESLTGATSSRLGSLLWFLSKRPTNHPVSTFPLYHWDPISPPILSKLNHLEWVSSPTPLFSKPNGWKQNSAQREQRGFSDYKESMPVHSTEHQTSRFYTKSLSTAFPQSTQ